MKFATRTADLTQSLTRRLFDLAQGIPDVIDLTLGDPDIIPPAEVRDAACRAIQEGRTRYSANAGLPKARAAIAEFNSKFYGAQITPEEVAVTVGGMEAIYLLLSTLVDPGDEVLVPGPYWVNYVQMTKLCGGVPVVVESKEEDNFAVTAEALEAAVTPKTKVLILNSPNNPTGRTIPGSTLDAIAKLAVERDIFVISDEVYRSLIYENRAHESIWTRPGMRERCALVDSMSKRFSMTGWRLGCVIAPKDLITTLTRFQENVAACAPLPSQYAAIEAYGGGVDASDMLAEFTKRRAVLLEGIPAIPKLGLSAIDGTFYAFVNISKTGLDSLDFSMRLLQEGRVAVVPGRTYGAAYDSFIRIAFTVKEDKLREAVKRIAAFAATL